jgi:hypothetical protein
VLTPTAGFLVGRPVRHCFPDRHHLFERAGAASLCGEVTWIEVQPVHDVRPGITRICVTCKSIAKGMEGRP